MSSETSTAVIRRPVRSSGRRSTVSWVTCAVVSVCVMLLLWHWYLTRLPDHVTIAGGPSGGRYDQLAQALSKELKDRLGITVNVRQTRGSLKNLRLLEANDVTLGLYQAETKSILDESEDSPGTLRFIANLYPEYLIPITSSSMSPDLTQLQDKTVSCNDDMSGDHALLRLLLEHLQSETSQHANVPYTQLPQALQDGRVDLAVISCGLGAPVLNRVFKSGDTRLTQIPFLKSFADRNIALTKRTIPAGCFATQPEPVPAEDFDTVTSQAQLLASSRAPIRVVEAVTETILDPRFQHRLMLNDLARGGTAYASSRPEFPIHAGASHIYTPELKPLLNPDFVEGTEGLRSFLVSIVAAIWLAHRWWNRRNVLSQEHRLDRYIRDVLLIEREQIGVDGNQVDDGQVLQGLLDRVTNLRQAALSEFTAHELNEDRAVDCFVEMCHALSDKISGKLTRHTLRFPVGSGS